MTADGSNVDTVLRGITFYSQSTGTSSHPKAVPDLQINSVKPTDSIVASHALGGSVHSKKQKTMQLSERSINGSKAKVADRRLKSVESLKLTSSKYRLINKPKHNLLPYKRGQIKFCQTAENVRIRALNSEQVSEKENKINSDACDCTDNAAAEKLSVRSGTLRRFFKTTFGKRRQFTFSMGSLTTGHNPVRSKCSTVREGKTAVRSKQLQCGNVASVCSEYEKKHMTQDHCENDALTVCNIYPSTESLLEDEVHTVEAFGESDNSQIANCGLTHGSGSPADIELDSGVTNVTTTPDTVGHLTASSKLYSETAVTSPSLQHGNFLFYMHCATCVLYCILTSDETKCLNS